MPDVKHATGKTRLTGAEWIAVALAIAVPLIVALLLWRTP